ncbi:MAG: hypothetical protein ABTQ32_05255 [Myxococcaceae bacterium]
MEAPNDSRLEVLVERLDRLERRHRTQRRWLLGAVALVVTLASSTLYAQVSWAPPGFNVFTADTPARASEVNDNFQWLIQNPGAAFLTTTMCPLGYTTYQGGEYLRLGVPSLTTVPRTLVAPPHYHQDLSTLSITGGAHAHAYNDYYWFDSGDTDDYGTPNGDGTGQRLDAPRATGTGGAHTHSPTGRVGPTTGVNGDANISITGELQHITLRLCVKQ